MFILLCVLLFLLSVSPISSSMKVTSSSPCQSVCATSVIGTTADDVVCFDDQYKSTTNGTNFQACVECELGSTAADTSNGVTDVEWGLFNLRFAFSTCVFSKPIQKVTVSTPCQVSCDPLQDAIGKGLDSNATVTDQSFCSMPSFDDTVGINRCAECYGRMDRQTYMANFLQALHISCLDPPRKSQPFPVTPNTIFNSTLIAAPTPSPSVTPGPHKPANLALIISLPVVFGVLIIAGIIGCCFYSARHRRRIMAERNAMRRIQDKYSPTFPPEHQQQYGSNLNQDFENAPPSEPDYSSPIMDRKENPYSQPQEQSSAQQPQQYPGHRVYSPADYANHSTPPTTTHAFIDTSRIGPGPDQKQVHTLHDQYFPPPPPQHPPEIYQPPPQPQEGIESLQRHHMKTPSLGLPIPKKNKKSLEAQRQNHEAEYGEMDHKDTIQLQDYRPGDDVNHSYSNDWRGQGAASEQEKKDDGVESPQVFVYDAVNERYVKEGSQSHTQ